MPQCCPTNPQFLRLLSPSSPRVLTPPKMPMNALDARIDCNGRFRPGIRCLSMQKPRVHTAECSPLLETPERPVAPGSLTCSLLPPPRQTIYPSIRETLP